ncbi:Ureidoglycolate lyase [Xylographa opegraphella]|nr:Ureidoglycolate lyase [Xylographa opegraphella]
MPGKKGVKAAHIDVEPLTRSSFSVFGSVIENPVLSLPKSGHAHNTPWSTGVSANQGTARKYSGISPMINLYKASSSHQEAKAVTTLFVCSPRQLRPPAGQPEQARGLFELTIMERHPYTTQTFTPMGLDPDDITTAYLVVVAPTVPSSKSEVGTPDTANIRAFLGRGFQAITYGAGTWHAPMIVIGKRDISFVVTQYMNGVADDDCQEIGFDAGGQSSLSIAVPEIRDFLREAKSKL